MVADPFETPGQASWGAGWIREIYLPAWVEDFIGPEYWALYNLDGLQVGTFEDGARWAVRAGSDWRYGSLIGGMLADAIELGAIVDTPYYGTA